MERAISPGRCHIIGACALSSLLALGAGCASTTRVTSLSQYPRAEDVFCHYVGLESVETPQREDMDSVTLLGVYRFGESSVAPPRQRLSMKFQVNRSRVDELRKKLEAHPDVICSHG